MDCEETVVVDIGILFAESMPKVCGRSTDMGHASEGRILALTTSIPLVEWSSDLLASRGIDETA